MILVIFAQITIPVKEGIPTLSMAGFLRIDRNLGRSPEAWGFLLFNLLVLIVVVANPSDRYLVIAAYFLETLIIGIFNVVRMAIIAVFSPAAGTGPEIMSSLQKERGTPLQKQSNLFLILFFIMHFGIFYFVQLGLLIGSANMTDRDFPGNEGFFPNPYTFFRAALSDQGAYILAGILVVQVFSLVYSFLIKGEYKVMNCISQGIQPYGRIILQQFVVLIGGFMIIIFQSAMVFSVLLIILKTFIDAWAQNKHNRALLRKMIEKA